MGDTILVPFRPVVAAAEAVDPVGTRCVVHKSTAGRFRFAQAVAATDDEAEGDRAEGDRPAGGVFGETDRLAGERAIEVDELAPPFDFAIGAHASDLLVNRIFRLAQNAVPAPGRDLKMFGRSGVAERRLRAIAANIARVAAAGPLTPVPLAPPLPSLAARW
jgi:hypothetical protein